MFPFLWPFTSEKYNNFHRIIQEFGEHQSKVINLLEILDLAKSLRDRGCHGIESKFADVSDWNKLLSA